MKNILRYYVRVIMFLMPLFWLPVVTDPWGFGKNWFLIGSALVGLVLWVITMLVGREEKVKINGIFWLVVVLGLWAVAGLLRLDRGVLMRSVVTLGGVGTILGLVAWFWLWLQVGSEEEKEKQLGWLTAGGIVVVLGSLAAFLIPSSKLPLVWPKNNPLISIDGTFSLTGSLLTEVILLAFLATEWLRKLIVRIKTNNNYLTGAIVTAVLFLGLGLAVFRTIKTGLAVMDRGSAWIIAAESFKRNPLWGAGAGNFVAAFNFYRPASYNMTPYWGSIFGGSRYGGLHLWTEMGLVGVILLAMILSKWFSQKKKNFGFWEMGLGWVAMLVLPLTWVGWWWWMWLMAGSLFEVKEKSVVMRVGEKNFNMAPWLVGIIVVVLSVGGGWQWWKILRGEMLLRGSLVAAAANDGSRTYNEQIKAIGANPWMAEYRKVYSQTNLALARTLLANAEISNEDREKAAVLVQQAVREGKAAVALDNQNPAYWTNLAAIYRELIGVVDGSADWSFQAYSQAAMLDTVNPMIKLDLGGLLYAANRTEEADRMFEQVVTMKPDLANGWYNWAYSAKKLGKLGEAVQRLSQAVALVPVDSGDYEKASKELVEWRKELEAAIAKAKETVEAPKTPETLKTPEPLPTGEEKVNVPKEELEPPISPSPMP